MTEEENDYGLIRGMLYAAPIGIISWLVILYLFGVL